MTVSDLLVMYFGGCFGAACHELEKTWRAGGQPSVVAMTFWLLFGLPIVLAEGVVMLKFWLGGELK